MTDAQRRIRLLEEGIILQNLTIKSAYSRLSNLEQQAWLMRQGNPSPQGIACGSCSGIATTLHGSVIYPKSVGTGTATFTTVYNPGTINIPTLGGAFLGYWDSGSVTLPGHVDCTGGFPQYCTAQFVMVCESSSRLRLAFRDLGIYTAGFYAFNIPTTVCPPAFNAAFTSPSPAMVSSIITV